MDGSRKLNQEGSGLLTLARRLSRGRLGLGPRFAVLLHPAACPKGRYQINENAQTEFKSWDARRTASPRSLLTSPFGSFLFAVSPGCALGFPRGTLADFVAEVRNLLGDVGSGCFPSGRGD